MNARFEGGASTALLYVESLTIRVGETTLKSAVPFPMHITLEYWPEVVAKDWEEPSQPEYLEATDARLLAPLFFTNSRGITTSLDGRLNVFDILSNEQYEKIVATLLQPNTCAAFDGKGVTL